MTRVVLRLIYRGVRDLALNPGAQIATFAAVTLATFMAGLFLMVLITLNHQLGATRGETVFQVYWHPGTDVDQISEQWASFSMLPGFLHVQTYSPEEALTELGEQLGRGRDGLQTGFPFLAERSPLPATALISFVPEGDDVDAWSKNTAAYLEALPGVSRVITTPLRDELGQAWRKVSRYLVWPSVGFLCLVLGLVVGNTIRLSLLARALEIEILQLSGAHNWYIRLPLVVSGSLLGLGGSLTALAILRIAHLQIRDVLNFSPLLMEIRFLTLPMTVVLILAPTLMAALASYLAVRDYVVVE